MRRLIWITAAGLALLGAGIAVAHEGHANSIAPVSATLTATSASDVHTDTCTGTDGTYTTTRGHWAGAVANATDASLNGNATIDARIVSGPKGGTLEGRLRVDGANHTVAGFEAVVDTSGNFAGLAVGHGSAPWNKLIGNISGNWTSTGGFTGGKLGGGTSGGLAVLLTRGGCRSTSTKPETIEAHGSLTLGANNATVTVAGVSCNVPSTLATRVASFHTSDRVEIKCTSASGTNTLMRIERKDDHH